MEKILEYFKVFADPTRLKILKLISDREICVCNLVEVLGMSQPAISNQLAKLKELGLVKTYRHEQWNFYRLDTEGLKRFIDVWKKFWEKDPCSIKFCKQEWQKLYEMTECGQLKVCERYENLNEE